MKHFLKPIYKVLKEGNQSMKWIDQYEKGLSIEQIMKISIDDRRSIVKMSFFDYLSKHLI